MSAAQVPDGTSGQAVREIAQLLHRGDNAGALEASDRAISLYPQCPDLWVDRGIALRKLKRLDDALASYDKAIELNPNDADCWLNRGICIRAMNRPHMHEKAVASYRKAVEIDPRCVDALMNLGNVSNRIAYYYASEAEAKKEFFRQSEEAYDRALAVKPGSWELWGNKAVVFIKQGRFREAAEMCDKSIALNPDYPDAWYLKGYALGELRRFDEALDAYKKAAAVMPPGDDFGLRVWINAGNMLFELRRFDEALEAYGTAAAIDPSFRMYYRGCRANAFYNQAVVYTRLGKADEAQQAYKRSIELRAEEENFLEPIKEFVGPAACDTEHIKEGA